MMLGLLALSRGKEVGAAFFVFFDPGLRKAAVPDFRENLAHFLARYNLARTFQQHVCRAAGGGAAPM